MDAITVHSLDDEQLTPFIERHRKNTLDSGIPFQTTIKKILKELFDIVPSESIFLLMDDPIQNFAQVNPRNLTYIGGVGEKADELVGLKTVTNQGLISQTYNFGSLSVLKASDTEKIVLDKVHLPHPVDSAICAPIRIGPTIGVLVMVNKKDPVGYTIKDVRMVNILSGYLEMSIQNAIDTKKIHEQTKRDNLTGLYNDRYFHVQLEREIKKAHQDNTPLSLMFLDLDFFKSINDQYGHLVGSQTLKEVSFVIREHMEFDGATLARYGGDEYVAILPGIELDKAVEMSENVRQGICEKMFMVSDGSSDQSMITFRGVLAASIGIASLHDHVPYLNDISQRKNLFIQMADKAMYRAKDLGKNQVCVASKMASE